MTEEERNHQKFMKHLEASKPSVRLIATWLVGGGCEVREPSSTVAETHAEWDEHADNGDLYIQPENWPSTWRDNWLRVEVKHRSLVFTDAASFRFPDIFVCAKHAYDRSVPKPYVFFSVNKASTHVATIYASSSDHWIIRRSIKDGRYENVRQDFYYAPLKYVKFQPLEIEHE